MRCYSVLVSVAVVLVGASVAVGQAPVVETLWVPDPAIIPSSDPLILSAEFVDIPETDRTVTIPPGTAVITWSFLNVTAMPGAVEYRPVIGDRFPVEGVHDRAGSWSTQTDGGTVTVKMQAGILEAEAGEIAWNDFTSLNWTLIVFPDTEPVPAISGFGLAVMAVAVVGVAGLVFSRKRQVV